MARYLRLQTLLDEIQPGAEQHIGSDNVIMSREDQMNKYPSIKLVMIANICTPHYVSTLSNNN